MQILSSAYPCIAVDEAGSWLIAWDAFITEESDRELFYVRSNDAGVTWTQPAALNSDFVDDDRDDALVQVSTDALGYWIAVWNAARPGQDSDVIMVRSSNAGFTWSDPMDVTPDGSGVAARQDFFPAITMGSSGSLLLTWNSTTMDWISLAVRAAASYDSGATWTQPVSFPVDVVLATRPLLVPGNLGRWAGVFTVDTSTPTTYDMDVMYAESGDSGATWTSLSPLEASPTGISGAVTLASDGGDRWIAGWIGGGDPFGAPATAFAAIGRIYGEEVPDGNRNSNSGSVGPCFLATAAFGTSIDARLHTLRATRDDMLLPSTTGAAFVDAYYRISPALAIRVSENRYARYAIRAALALMVSGLEGRYSSISISATSVLAAAAAIYQVTRRRSQYH